MSRLCFFLLFVCSASALTRFNAVPSECHFRVTFTYGVGSLRSTTRLHDEVAKLIAKTYGPIESCHKPLYDSSSCYKTIVGGVVYQACNVNMAFTCDTNWRRLKKCSHLKTSAIVGKRVPVDDNVKAKITNVVVEDVHSVYII